MGRSHDLPVGADLAYQASVGRLVAVVLGLNLNRVSIAAWSRSTRFADARTAAPATTATPWSPPATPTQPLAPRWVCGPRLLSSLFVVCHRA